MILFPNCKINLGLYVTGKRPDGFHDLQTAFYPVPLHDVLEIIEKPEAPVSLSLSGIKIEDNNHNTCLKAYALLKKEFPKLPPVYMHLHKVIPIGGGLGGGSSDGVHTLLLLQKKFNLKLPEEKLQALALTLGSDCPFFINNQPCLATGRGEVLRPFAIDLTAYKIVLVNPGIHINTGWAFSQVTLQTPALELKAILQMPVTQWKDHLFNIFEKPIFDRYPEIKNIKDVLYQKGAVYAAMSGSGATVYGLFKKMDAVAFSFPPHYFVKEC